MREQSALGGCPDIRMNLFMFIIGVGRGKPPVPTDEEIPLQIPTITPDSLCDAAMLMAGRGVIKRL